MALHNPVAAVLTSLVKSLGLSMSPDSGKLQLRNFPESGDYVLGKGGPGHLVPTASTPICPDQGPH